MSGPQLVWLRRDLRLSDQAAFHAAARSGPVIVVYILDDEGARHRKMGAASRWWLHHSLHFMKQQLEEKGSRLILRRGSVAPILSGLVRETGAAAIHFLSHYEPWWRNAERELRQSVGDDVSVVAHDGNYLFPPGQLRSGGGTPYKIFTPFWNALQDVMPPPAPLPAPESFDAPDAWPVSDNPDDWGLLPVKPDWATGFSADWRPGSAGAAEKLEIFRTKTDKYAAGRDLPSEELVSRLSPHLHFGEISPAQVWHAVAGKESSAPFLRQLGWRDYAQNLILQYPEYGRKNGRDTLDILPWRNPDDPEVRGDLNRWKAGKTGYPIVDAGMRQLWQTGWMHNRVRMIVAAFLTRHLLIDWRVGEQWFWDTLVDADYGNNAANWQWVAGTGIDSNMFVRIMAPLSQSEKFAAGDYIRKWVPELSKLSEPHIHDPDAFGMRPDNYPSKIIGHREGRERALAAYRAIRGS